LCDAKTKDVRKGEMSKFAALSGCAYNDEICLLALNLRLLFVIQPEISLRQSQSCLRERSVSALDKDVYTWISSASKFWLLIRHLSGVVNRVNSSCPRTEP